MEPCSYAQEEDGTADEGDVLNPYDELRSDFNHRMERDQEWIIMISQEENTLREKLRTESYSFGNIRFNANPNWRGPYITTEKRLAFIQGFKQLLREDMGQARNMLKRLESLDYIMRRK